jgi:hypothetical protein
MFYFWLKPKGTKKIQRSKRGITYDFCTLANVVCAMAWIMCIPFLFTDFHVAYPAFAKLTVAQLVFGFLSKLTHPKYYYF